MSINQRITSINEDSIEMVCVNCSKRSILLDDANSKRVERLCEDVKFYTTFVSTVVYGLCDCCKNKKEQGDEK